MEANIKLSLSQEAKIYATLCHKSTNHLYKDMPYDFHLLMVVTAAKKFIHLIPEEDRETVIAGCWVHDVIEDTRQTYNDVKEVLGEQVAELAYALTNEKGRTRKDRANEKYYSGIRNVKYANFIKVCDRIANVRFSISQQSTMLNKYKNENNDFYLSLHTTHLTEMFTYLNELLK